MPDELNERFNKERVGRCMAIFQLIINNWIKRNTFSMRVVADEPVEGKTLEELGKMYFDIGVGGDLRTLPFIDMLIVLKALAEHGREDRPKGKETREIKIVTRFSDDEAYAILRDVERKIGIEVRGQAAKPRMAPPKRDSVAEGLSIEFPAYFLMEPGDKKPLFLPDLGSRSWFLPLFTSDITYLAFKNRSGPECVFFLMKIATPEVLKTVLQTLPPDRVNPQVGDHVVIIDPTGAKSGELQSVLGYPARQIIASIV